MWNVRFASMTLILLFNQVSFAKEIAGEIVSVNGVAFIRPDQSSAPLPKSPPKAKPGDNVYVGDVINTSSEGAVKILMRDKSIVDLGASSLFKVDEYIHNHGSDRKAKMDLVFGKVRVAVTKKIEDGGSFQVKTKGATMGVRGTEFSVVEQIPTSLSNKQKAGEETTQVTVFQGKVDVSAPKTDVGSNSAPAKTVSLTSNMQLTTGAGVPAGAVNVPITLSNAQMKQMKTETQVMDNTFSKAITIEPMSAAESSGGGRSPASGEKSGPILNLPTLPPVVGPLPPLDVPGRPTVNNSFANVNSTMKRLTVTIVTAP